MIRTQAERLSHELDEALAARDPLRLANVAQDVRSTALLAFDRGRLLRRLASAEAALKPRDAAAAASAAGEEAAAAAAAASDPAARERRAAVMGETAVAQSARAVTVVGETRVLEPENGDVVLVNCRSARIECRSRANSVRLYESEDVELLLADVNTSVTVENCARVRAEVNCQQLRCHRLRECAFAGFVKQPPLLEDCVQCVLRREARALPLDLCSRSRIEEAEEL